MNAPTPEEVTGRRAVHIGVLVVIVAAFVGLVAGFSQDVPISRPAEAHPVDRGDAPLAPTYGSLLERGPVPRAAVGPSLQALARAAWPGRTEPVAVAPNERASAVEARASSRAYDGAPPTIPHAVDTRGLPCLACHETGFVVGQRVAPAMSHRAYTSCTQCHVPAEAPLPPHMARLPQAVGDNQFVGLEAPLAGDRAWGGAPPVIPHHTSMRETCMSCHGPLGAAGLKTSHPSRQSCTQCHAPSAALDQRVSTSEPHAEAP